MPDPTIPDAAIAAVRAIGVSAGLYDEEIHDILTAAAPHIGAAYLQQAQQTVRTLLEEATNVAHDAAWNPDLTEGERQRHYGLSGGLRAALEALGAEEADRG